MKGNDAMNITAYFDGCCEPINPGGTASYGALVLIDNQRVWQASQIVSPEEGREKETSNNVAEYAGLISLLEYLLSRNLQNEPIQVYGDSRLVIYQMFGDPKLNGKRWKIKRGYYTPLAYRALELLKRFSSLKGDWIPREENALADELSKAELLKAGISLKIQPGGQ